MGNQQYRQQEKPRCDWHEKQQHRQQEHAVGGKHCPHCGAEITQTCELCPVCGKPIDDTVCSFCGAPFEGDERFCAECGSPRAGIKCPRCGTLFFRSFCGKCNAPLNDNAAEALAAAKADPHFQRAQQLQQEMEQMEAYLYELKEEIEQALAADEAEGEAPDLPGLSDEGEKTAQPVRSIDATAWATTANAAKAHLRSAKTQSGPQARDKGKVFRCRQGDGLLPK